MFACHSACPFSGVMTVGAVHLQPVVTVPAGLVLVAWICWYWLRLGRDEVPASRRWIRRASLLVMLIGLPALVRATSFVDPMIEPREYARMWTVAIVALALLVIVALVDAVNSLRLHAVEVTRLQRESLRRRAPAPPEPEDGP